PRGARRSARQARPPRPPSGRRRPPRAASAAPAAPAARPVARRGARRARARARSPRREDSLLAGSRALPLLVGVVVLRPAHRILGALTLGIGGALLLFLARLRLVVHFAPFARRARWR